jgi:hypothetical protein
MKSKAVRHRLFVVIVAAAGALAVAFLTTAVRSAGLNESAVHAAAGENASFTLRQEEIHRFGHDLSAPGRLVRKRIIAQRSDGSRSETDHWHPGQPQEYQVRVVRRADFAHIKAWDTAGFRTTWAPWTEEARLRRLSLQPTAASQCTADARGNKVFGSYQSSTNEVFDGIAVTRFSKRDPRMEVWHAPGFNCEEIRRVIYFESCCSSRSVNEQAPNTSELRTVAYVRGEPDQALFAVEHLRESAPAQAMEKTLRQAGYPEEFVRKQIVEMQESESRYWAARAAAGIAPASR